METGGNKKGQVFALLRVPPISPQGVFATHIHVLLDMELQLPNVELMSMEVQRAQQAEIGGEQVRRLSPASHAEDCCWAGGMGRASIYVACICSYRTAALLIVDP